MNIPLYKSQKSLLWLGVDIGSAALKIALLQRLLSQTRLLSYKCLDISSLKDDEKDGIITQQVEDFIKSNGLTQRAIHLNLPITNAVYTKTIKLPLMPTKEIPSAAKWQIKDDLPVKVDEMEFAWQYATAPAKPSKPKIDIICVAAKKDFLNKFVQLFKRSNISLSEITFSPFSISAVLPAEEEWVPVLDIGFKQSVFSMHSKGRVLFVRLIHVGTDNFNQQPGAME